MARYGFVQYDFTLFFSDTHHLFSLCYFQFQLCVLLLAPSPTVYPISRKGHKARSVRMHLERFSHYESRDKFEFSGVRTFVFVQ